jgi:hypothetical protein
LPYSKWLNGLHTFLACVAVVMLGGTRILDFGAYEGVYSYLREAGAAATAPAASFQAESCSDDYSGAASDIGTCSFWEVKRVGQQVVGAPMVDQVELPKQHMPLQFLADRLESEQQEASPAPLSPHGIDPWTPAVPNPPPRSLVAYV